MNIFLEKSVAEVVELFRIEGRTVEYKFKPEDPEYANGYVVDPGDRNKIFAIISSVVRWREKMPDWDLPPKAKSCIQTTSEGGVGFNFGIVISKIKQKLGRCKQ